MKNLFIAFTCLAFTACASQQVYKSAPQNYRLKGAENTIEIKGATFQTKKAFKTTHFIGIYFNNNLQIEVTLDNQLNGESEGTTFEGKKTSATCTGRVITRQTSEIRCMVFIDNEKTVTLTF
jgi:hypothetical protein